MNIEFPLKVLDGTSIVDFLGRPVGFIDVPHHEYMDEDKEFAELVVAAVNYYAAPDQLVKLGQENGDYGC